MRVLIQLLSYTNVCSCYIWAGISILSFAISFRFVSFRFIPLPEVCTYLIYYIVAGLPLRKRIKNTGYPISQSPRQQENHASPPSPPSSPTLMLSTLASNHRLNNYNSNSNNNNYDVSDNPRRYAQYLPLFSSCLTRIVHV